MWTRSACKNVSVDIFKSALRCAVIRFWYFLPLYSIRPVKLEVGKNCIQVKRPIRPELIPVSVAWSDWEYFYSPLDGMLVHRRVNPSSIEFADTHWYTSVLRGIVKCLVQEHNTVFPARARTQSSRSRVELTNHDGGHPASTIVEVILKTSLRERL